ncbi:hypothetical protein J4558_10105 [Leptolyngbya sp. 15MV]|nr:hypothetical protein J4558_10105 [Leptolyngbya sp. 15MV]
MRQNSALHRLTPIMLALTLSPALLSACRTSADAGQTPRTGSGAPARLSMSATDFVDTDASGFRDAARVVVYVFSEDSVLPLRARGTLDLRLVDRREQELARWRFGPDDLESRAAVLPPGPAFVLDISLESAGVSERLDVREGELVCVFRAAGSGDVIGARTSSAVRIGPVGRATDRR